ncbi:MULTISPECIES: cache domain-containing protein [unclassified Hydrogenophaga]|uniref:cache domain-containing protein n=1 Tax=unclassified Hydrogenophaga TaxID=2610897 RepID=UPI000877FDFF|nr:MULTISPECIES: cache domain-containing protein [unclassified Hydrogenophaga]MBN9369588.1 cache domain-containing protein [Hydrogenophaga sp.]OJV69739.1 MAG: histidine kinase [Hydrogenophaga sp. 70-12]
MRLRTKILLLAILPMLAALALIALAVQQQERALAQREHALVERAYMDARRSELRSYVDLAVSTVQPLYDRRGGEAEREQALRLLASLDYGPDGYFFVYDLQGKVLMHSRQTELVGQNLWELRDPQGRPTIQRLIAQARAGGGFVDYLWQQPSSGLVKPKLGYVIALERWGWMMGTGLYLDGIQATLSQLEREANRNIATTLLWIAGIAGFGIALISASGLALNLSEQRVAENKLRLLARQVQQSQEDERARLARELHDGVSQTLVSSKLLVEAGAADGDRESLARALRQLENSLVEVRRISHRLRPALLDNLGLPAALQHLAREVEDASGLAVAVRLEGAPRELGDEVKTALFRIAQEGLTNVVKHAQARQVELLLGFGAGGALRLSLTDDGRGFDEQAVQLDPERGIGLRNMRERLAAIGGRLRIQSAPGHGTQLEAALPA